MNSLSSCSLLLCLMVITESCMRTIPPDEAYIPVTMAPEVLACSPDTIVFAEGDKQISEFATIDVTYSDPTTTAGISTMEISCSAAIGYNVLMELNGLLTPVENNQDPPPQTVTINAQCNTADMKWNYVFVVNGVASSEPLDSVTCLQVPNIKE